VCNSVDIIRNHPLTPQEVPVHGLIIDPNTGLLDLVVDGYKELPVLTGGMPYAHTEWLASIPGPTTMPIAGAAAGAITGGDGDDVVTLEQRHEDAIARAAIRARSVSSCDGDDAGAEPPLEPAGEAAAAAEARMLVDTKARAAGKGAAAAAAAAPQSPGGGGSFAALGISVASSSLDRTAERAATALAAASVAAGAPQAGPGGTIGRRERPRAPMSAIFSVGIN
jgi:hypothetical protein